MRRATITYFGTPLDCTYRYSPPVPATRIDPPEPACVEIESILIGGVETLDVWTVSQLEDIETKLVDAHEDGIEAARQDYWDTLRKERALEESRA